MRGIAGVQSGSRPPLKHCVCGAILPKLKDGQDRVKCSKCGTEHVAGVERTDAMSQERVTQAIADVEATLREVVDTVRCIDADKNWRSNLVARLEHHELYVALLRATVEGRDDAYESRMRAYLSSRGVPPQIIEQNIAIARADRRANAGVKGGA